MKKVVKLPLIIFALVDIVASAIIIPLSIMGDKASAGFWIGWVFAAIVGFGVFAGLIFYAMRDKATRLIALNTVGYTAGIAEVLYIISFIISAYALSGIAGTVFSVVGGVVITLAVVVVVLVKFTGISVLREANETQAKTIAAKKSTYIPNLMRQVTSALIAAKDDKVKASLTELSALVAASPEMSEAGAAMAERELNALVYQITQLVVIGETDEVCGLIDKAKMKLSERNLKCPL